MTSYLMPSGDAGEKKSGCWENVEGISC